MKVTLGPFHCTFTPWRPADGHVFDGFAYDTETTDIDHNRPYITPHYVIGAACDGKRGVFVSRENLRPFLEAHREASFTCHNAAFDLKVTDAVVRPTLDVYLAVDENRIWDTQVLQRLHSLATVGHTARGTSGLAACALEHLGVTLRKDQTDAAGNIVRTGFAPFLGKPPSAIPETYLTYLAHDALITWHLFEKLHGLIRGVLRGSGGAFGHAGDDWLRDAIRRFGPLTHHVQLRASIVMDALGSTGIGLDRSRYGEKAEKVRRLLDECKERLRNRGFLVDAPGNGKALQSILDQFHRKHSDVELARTATGKWSTAADDLAELECEDDFFADYALYRQAEKLQSTYLRKMEPARLYPRFGYLLATGRTYCCGGFNLQNLPTERTEGNAAETIRGCFVPGEGNVFIDADYSQIELVVLAYALEHQFRHGPSLAKLINENNDIHRLIAAAVLGKSVATVTKDERQSAKPVSFGRPGGMGVGGLRRVAKSGYGIDLTDEEVHQRIEAYHRLCPELNDFLRDEVDTGLVLASALDLTPARYDAALGSYFDSSVPANRAPAGWAGGMLLKALREDVPRTRGGKGRPYTNDELDFLWSEAQRLPLKLKPQEQAKLRGRQADRKLWEAASKWAGRRAVFTLTGRLRANATFCASRNTIFQGAAADGALLGLWLVWRASYRIVDFVHDQLVVEAPADDRVLERVAHIESLMRTGMLSVVPGMSVKVETVVARSLNKADVVR